MSSSRRQVLFGAPLVIATGLGLLRCSPAQKSLRIGALFPLTGDLAKFGESFRRGASVAIDASSVPLDVIYDDDAGDAARGVTAFSRLIDAEGVVAVVGGATSPVAMAMAPIADRRKVVLISPAATAPALSGYNYFYRVQPSDSFEGKLMAQFATKSLQKPEVAVVYVNNDWGQGLQSVFAQAYRNQGGAVATFAFESGQTDFRALISQLKGLPATYIYLLGYLKELVAFLTQATELELGKKYLGAFSMDDGDLVSRIPAATLNGSFVTVPAYDPNDPKSGATRRFISAYAKRYGGKPDQFAAHAYDATAILVQAIAGGAQSGPQVKSYLDGHSFDGATGLMTFRGGDVKKPYRILEFKDGKFAERGYVAE